MNAGSRLAVAAKRFGQLSTNHTWRGQQKVEKHVESLRHRLLIVEFGIASVDKTQRPLAMSITSVWIRCQVLPERIQTSPASDKR